MNSAERLALLLPLANGDPLPPKAVRQALLAFLDGFSASGLRVRKDAGIWEAFRDAPEAELKAVQRKVAALFASGFLFDGPPPAGLENIGPDDLAPQLSFPSVRFLPFKPPRGQKQARRGRFTQMVDGSRLRDLVPFLAMHLLTTEDIIVSRCSAPRFERWDEQCSRFFIWTGRGRPSNVCSGGQCAARVKNKARNDRYQTLRRENEEWRKLHNKKGTKGKKR